MNKLILIRGLPGSGKSTFARELASYIPDMYHLEADQFMVNLQDEYEYHPGKVVECHKICQEAARMHLSYPERRVVVSNTFTRMWELVPYYRICQDLSLPEPQIIDMHFEFESIHEVPAATLSQMRDRWEQFNLSHVRQLLEEGKR